MKYRNIALLLTVGIIGASGWHNSRRLEEVREKRRVLREQAVKLGIGSGKEPQLAHKSKIREVLTDSPSGKVMPEGHLAFLRDMEERRKNKTALPADARERYKEIYDYPLSLSPAQLRKYIAEVRSLEDLPEHLRRNLIELSINVMAEKSPAEGLDMAAEFDEKSPHPQGFPRFEGLLGKWAAKDAPAALAWVRANLADHGMFITSNSRCALISAIGKTDRKLAFRLVGELGIETPSDATQGIVGSAKTNEERNSALADLREYLPTVEDRNDRNRAGDYAVAVFGRNLAAAGFQEASAWADSAGLTQSEFVSFASDIGTSIKDGEQGKWIEWLGQGSRRKGCRKP